MNTTDPEMNYLCDLGRELLSMAKRISSESESRSDQFQRGRRFGIYEVLSLMKQQATAFGLSERQIGLDGTDIEELLR